MVRKLLTAFLGLVVLLILGALPRHGKRDVGFQVRWQPSPQAEGER